MNIVQIPTSLLDANDYNPNIIEENIMVRLKKDVERVGIKQPIIVRKHPTEKKKYIIIDGEHRWRVATDLKIKEVPCEILDMDDNEAKIMTITMNRFRGEFDSIKLAEVLKSLKDTYSAEELEERLGYNPEELQSYEDLLEFDPSAFDTGASDEDIEAIANDMVKNEELLNELSLSLTLNQLEIIEGAIGVAGPKSAITKEEAIEVICKQFLENNQPQILKEIEDRMKQLDSIVKEEQDTDNE